MLEKVIDQMREGKLNPLQAARKADQEIGGITGVFYKPGLKLTLQNHVKRFCLDRHGYAGKEIKKLEEFAALAYWQAQQNGSIMPGEVHLGKGLSTKHYSRAFKDYTLQLLDRCS